MADPQTIKAITENLERTYSNLRLAANNIAGLLQVGRATCDEIKAYNLWALSTYNLQKGMLATLRNAGESVPRLPTQPELFAWQGQSGAAAVNFDCSGQESSLSGAMKKALRGPSERSVYLSVEQVGIVPATEEDAASAPSFAQMAASGLGVAPIVILLIAGISVAVYFAIDAISAYLTENSIQRETTERTAIQSQAFATYTRARLDCYNDCIARGGDQATCVDTCARLVDKPDIKIDSARAMKDWGFFQWVGFSVVVAAGGIVSWKLWEKKQRGESLLPSF